MPSPLYRLDAEVTSIFVTLSPAETQLTSAAAPGGWNIQQIAEHLLLTFRASRIALGARQPAGFRSARRTNLLQWPLRLSVLWLGLYPPGRKALARFCPSRPATLCSGAELARRLGDELGLLLRLLSAGSAYKHDLRVEFDAGFGTLTPAEVERYHMVHVRHHLRQIERILREHKKESASGG